MVPLRSLLKAGVELPEVAIPIKPQASQDLWPLPTKLVGIEVELENVSDAIARIPLTLWKKDKDGSLRNNGREFISKPVYGDILCSALSQLNRFFTNTECGQNCRATYRTSVHVHVNMMDETPADLVKIVKFYTLVEPLIFETTAKWRKNSQFCVPLLQDKHILDAVFRILRDIRINSEGAMIAAQVPLRRLADIKYAALNLGALYQHGTIEFRHHPGSRDAADITRWIVCIQSIIRMAKEYEEVDYHKLGWSRLMEIYSSLPIYDPTAAVGAINQMLEKAPLLAMIEDYRRAGGLKRTASYHASTAHVQRFARILKGLPPVSTKTSKAAIETGRPIRPREG